MKFVEFVNNRAPRFDSIPPSVPFISHHFVFTSFARLESLPQCHGKFSDLFDLAGDRFATRSATPPARRVCRKVGVEVMTLL